MEKNKFIPYYFYRLLKWKFGDKIPASLVAKITYRCNLKCPHCPWRNLKSKEIPAENWFKIIKFAKKIGCMLLIIEGGEPLLRNDLNDIIKFAKDEGMMVSVITNGTMNFSDINADIFWVSIDGVDEIYRKVRGVNFNTVFSNVKKARKIGKKVISLTSISELNKDYIPQIVKTLNPHVDGIWFNFIYPYHGVNIAMGIEERIEVAKKIMKMKMQGYNIINSYSFLRSVGKKKRCYPFLTLNASPDGKLFHGCTVEQLEKCHPEKCDMGCYGEMSRAIELKKDAVEFLLKSTGMKVHKLLFLR